MNLKNKRILITAGPTWVPIDGVRVISNVATGETGIILSEKLQRLGAKVTLLLGPQGNCCRNTKIRLIRFRFFNELKDMIKRELRSRKYDIIIHSAAVSDYKLKKGFTDKVKSGIKQWKLDLVPTARIIDSIKRRGRNIFLVGFKFKPKATKRDLISEAVKLMARADADLVVANTVYKGHYQAYIVNKDGASSPFNDKVVLAKGLTEALINR